MKLRLQAKATLTIALLIVLVLTVSSWLYYYTASQALDAEMSERLVAIAKAVTTQLNGEYLKVLEPGGEDSRLYRSLQLQLQAMREATGARRIYVFDLTDRSLVDSREQVPIGTSYRFLDADQIHIEQTKQGVATVSIAYRGEDGTFYKSAYAPVRDGNGNVTAILAVDASVLFLETLAAMRRNMLLIGTLSTLLAVGLSALFVRSITIPVKRLVKATRRLKAGDFGTQVATQRRDELGELTETFNEMSLAIRARDHKLVRLAEELKQMSAGLAHEVRNPLNGMRIYLGLLKRELTEDSRKAALIQQIDREIQSLNQLVTDFLDFARPSPLEPQPAHLAEIIDSVLSLHETELQENAIEVELSGLADLPTVEVDTEQIRWMLINLAKNAIQAMPDKGKLTITGSMSPAGGGIQIDFSDTGIGMPPDVVERAFDAFFTTKDTGTGLGLAVVRRLIEAHRGAIECQSAEGEGTTFRISLPKSQTDTREGTHELDIDRRRPSGNQ